MGLFCVLMLKSPTHIPFARSNANADGLQGHLSFFLIKKSMDIYVNSLLPVTSIKSNTKELYHSTCFVLKKFQWKYFYVFGVISKIFQTQTTKTDLYLVTKVLKSNTLQMILCSIVWQILFKTFIYVPQALSFPHIPTQYQTGLKSQNDERGSVVLYVFETLHTCHLPGASSWRSIQWGSDHKIETNQKENQLRVYR